MAEGRGGGGRGQGRKKNLAKQLAPVRKPAPDQGFAMGKRHFYIVLHSLIVFKDSKPDRAIEKSSISLHVGKLRRSPPSWGAFWLF